MASEGLTSCAFTYRSQRKGENPVTRDYYQLTHEIANHGAVMERGETVRHQTEAELVHRALPCLASPPDKQQDFLSIREKKIRMQILDTKVIPVFHN